MAHLDIIVYAVVAVLLLARLWMVFGRRNDEDRPPSVNPFAAPPAREDEDAPRARAAQSFAPIKVAPASLLGGLEQVKGVAPDFDEKVFLQAVRQDFTQIVGDFAKGDLSASASLLAPAVRAHFEAAIAARQKAGETLENKIARIKDAEVTEARVEDGRAFITVRIDSEQENILRDASGGVVSGAGQLEEIIDIWVFSREAKAAGWVLAETRTG